MRTSCRAWATRATGCSVRRTDAPGASGGGLAMPPPRNRPRFRPHPALPATHPRRLHSFSRRFHCICGRFRGAAPSAAPSRHDKIRIRSTQRLDPHDHSHHRLQFRLAPRAFASGHAAPGRASCPAPPRCPPAAPPGRPVMHEPARTPPAGKRGTTRGNGQAEIGGTGGRLDGPTRATGTSGRQPFT
ncbi:hypothetical protein HDG37_001635 [Paraburkholderia sp. MM5384-R2]|nr:hypothetical protein [Paraburkholderia sp. MM5384-R2]